MNGQVSTIAKLLENIAISAWIIDDGQNIVYMNPAMQNLFGDLSGKKTSIVYMSSNLNENPPDMETSGLSEVIITEVPFRRLRSEAELDGGRFFVEYFEDISEQKLLQNNMALELAKMKAEIETAKTIQNRILPIDNTYWNTIAFSSLSIPAGDLGGDFFDLIKVNDDEYIVYIADVSGHGIHTALLAVFMRERVKANTEAAFTGTGELLKRLVRDFNALGIDGMMYITMALCKYSKSKRELSVSNAGHNCFPLIVRDNSRIETVPTRGLPICVIAEDADYDEETVSLNPGDRLILYTDGVVDEVDSSKGRAFGHEGVRESAEKYHDYNGGYLVRKIMEESDRYSLISAKDDRSILVADILA